MRNALETICGKRIERIPQEFVRARTEAIERPALLQDLRELCHADKVGRRSLFQRIETNRDIGIGWLHEDQLVAQVSPEPPLARVDRAEKKRGRIAVEVEIQKSPISFDVLLAKVPQERTLAGTGFAKHCNMHRAAHIAQFHMPPRHLPVVHPKPQIQTPALLPCSATSAQEAPDRRNELFNEWKHDD